MQHWDCEHLVQSAHKHNECWPKACQLWPHNLGKDDLLREVQHSKHGQLIPSLPIQEYFLNLHEALDLLYPLVILLGLRHQNKPYRLWLLVQIIRCRLLLCSNMCRLRLDQDD